MNILNILSASLAMAETRKVKLTPEGLKHANELNKPCLFIGREFTEDDRFIIQSINTGFNISLKLVGVEFYPLVRGADYIRVTEVYKRVYQPLGRKEWYYSQNEAMSKGRFKGCSCSFENLIKGEIIK